MPGGVTPELARQREETAWELRQKCWTTTRIAQHLGISRQAVDKILDRVEARVLKRLDSRVGRSKARQTHQLEWIAEQASVAWERSTRDAETVKTVIEPRDDGAGDGDEDGDGAEGIAEATIREERTVKGQAGDPALLNQARGALADIRKIWGLDAPIKAALTTVDDFDADASDPGESRPPQPGEPGAA